LSGCERKNGWQLAAWMGEMTPCAVQHLLDWARWDADLARDRVRSYAIEELRSADAVLIVDETGFLKKVLHSAGVKRQYTGTAGRTLDSGATVAWVAADEVYGHDSKMRRFLESRQMAYGLAVASDQRLWQADFMQHRVDAIAQSLPASRWERLSAGFGSKGERLYDWALMELSKQDGWTRALLVRRSIEEKPEYAYYPCYAPLGKDTIEALVRVAGERWKIEQCFQTAKGECGLDHYEVRIGGAGIGISRCRCWPMQCYPYCEREEKNSRRAGATERARTAPSAHRHVVARMARP
jgi:SRSO17 transposase